MKKDEATQGMQSKGVWRKGSFSILMMILMIMNGFFVKSQFIKGSFLILKSLENLSYVGKE